MRSPPRGQAGSDIFEILVREHADMLTAYLRSAVSDSSAVDDLFQETMIVAWKRIGDYDRSRPFGPWLRGIARKLILAHHRKAGANPVWCTPEVLDAVGDRFDALAKRPGDTFRERVEVLLDCVAKLSDAMRQVVELAYARGLQLKEIATALGETEEAIKKRAQRARSMLHDCLMQAGATP